MNEEIDGLKQQLKDMTSERNELHAKLVDSRLANIEKILIDHESRLRVSETIATRSNVLYALATGGGLISIITLFRVLSGIP